MRKHGAFAEGEYYHIYNRGVEKRTITEDWKDSERFLQSLELFNTIKPIGSIYNNSFKDNAVLRSSTPKLVDIVAYCLNPNHYHLILTPLVDGGIEKFMQKFGTGFTNYFNEKYKRSGGLFQGKFKSAHIDSNEYLLHVSSYVNLNDRVHRLRSRTPKSGTVVRSSWFEYLGKIKEEKEICNKDIVLGQFKNTKEYEKYAKESLRFTLANRYEGGELSKGLLAQDEYPDMFDKENKLKKN